MKRIALAVLPAFLLYTSPAHAWVGGPWSNNVPGGESWAGSTFQGVISGKNISGIMIFGVAPTSSANATTTAGATTTSTRVTQVNLGTLPSQEGGMWSTGSEGRAMIFVQGSLVVCQMNAVVDLPGKTLSGTVDGSRVRSQQTLVKTMPSTTVNGGQSTTQFVFTDVLTIAGTFDSRITETFPNMIFSGNGTVSVTAPVEPYGVTEMVVGASLDPNAVSANTGAVTTKFIPIDQTVDYKIRVSGVQTSNLPPSFGAVIQLQYSSVQTTAAGAGGPGG